MLRWWEAVEFVVVFEWARHFSPFQWHTVSGMSMAPTLLPGDQLLAINVIPFTFVASWAHRLGGGSGAPTVASFPDLLQRRVVTARFEDGFTLCKRVHRNADVGKEASPGQLLLLGDNPDASYDGRQCGPVPFGAVETVVLCRLRSHVAPSTEPGRLPWTVSLIE